ncbi:cryptochrome/photolyase family protein [Phaeobacter marinintestinus]|uniref:cryptochrome/photolyase family protein n=1 Tax=Falsiphaeobacter marinintestinus TaxID=1492905 RepID=UPI0011B3B4BC|nr:deoxyribodipyrimidine photo-lyase [Phaeobacter marinintestinus]
MTDIHSPILLWFRRDLRLSDHPALAAACATGRPVIPVFICDEAVETLGAAPKWRLGLGLEVFSQAIEARGSRLVLRRGKALEQLKSLIAQTGAGAVWWTRAYDPHACARDTEIKTALKAQGVEARSFGGHLLFEPWTVETKTGGFYRVYSPMWRAVRGRHVDTPVAAPAHIPAPAEWPVSDVLNHWALGTAMQRGADVVRKHVRPGEDAAHERLDAFISDRIENYKEARDCPSEDATSGMSEYLTYGEISPHQMWHAGMRAQEEGKRGAEHFLKELVWREFAYHLMYHTPHILTGNWRPEWDGFPWKTDADSPEVTAWKRGRTGVPFVDAAMREMFVTGRMHNRARMIVGSYLTKHLMTHWKIGLDWFEQCLTDWDPASNAMGWQWVAGSGPDAAPYFRVFNPVTQLTKFDPRGAYARRWIAEGQAHPSDTALRYFDAVPCSWALTPDAPYPQPIVDIAEGRKRALAAYQDRSTAPQRTEILPDGKVRPSLTS